ncbi:MAG: lipopolysaccharide transport periplasmic protein LptA [Gammaproteobacteria bacterium]|nr:lipopolysaccharide transport periplasmic protein LptA [Gammaproteobacteria bacterium]
MNAKLILLSLLWIVSTRVYSVPLNIEADTAVLDQRKGTAEYRGHVRIEQGKLKIQAMIVRVLAENNQVQDIWLEGTPDDPFQFVDDSAVPPMRGSATKAHYRVKEQTMQLSGQARLEQGGQLLQGPTLDYDRKLGRLRAGHNPTNNPQTPSDRVKFIIKDGRIQGSP